MSKPVLDKWEAINIIDDHGGPNKKLLDIMKNSKDYGECFNVKIVNDEVLKKYHGDNRWFAGDGPDYTGSLGYAIEKLYGVKLIHSEDFIDITNQ
tara:strand:- start:912 stop:1196 length:285 start_codon:yes stop_codon:yes gene_type:complete